MWTMDFETYIFMMSWHLELDKKNKHLTKKQPNGHLNG